MSANMYHETHEYYTQKPRHWDPQSEAFTGGDSLLTALRSGWALQNHVLEQKYALSGGRATTIYYVLLLRENRRRIMPVVANPFVERLLMQLKIEVRQIADEQAIDAVPFYNNVTQNTDTSIPA